MLRPVQSLIDKFESVALLWVGWGAARLWILVKQRKILEAG
jgi:hypothetical protein